MSTLEVQDMSALNARDLASANSGRMALKPGRLFRSAQLASRDERAARFLIDEGIRTVFDLRTPAEQGRDAATPMGWTGNYLARDVLGDSDGGDLMTQIHHGDVDVDALAEMLKTDAIADFMRANYRKFVTLPSACVAYGTLFRTISRGTPLLFHCTAGKDRTGWAAAALLTLLGAAPEAVMDDYLASMPRTPAAYVALEAELKGRGVTDKDLLPILGVERSFLEAAFDEMNRAYGSIEDYFRTGLGMDDAHQDVLRETLSA